jgi:hypothetical protein
LQLLGNGTRMRMFFVLNTWPSFRAQRLVTSRREGQTLFHSLAKTGDTKLLRKVGIADIETPVLE